tara:strand:+ start:604 stop:1272 length:669 start_codon:yes stop_codon:yes gene_type:complete
MLNIIKEEHFRSPIWIMELPEYVEALDKASDKHIRNAIEHHTKNVINIRNRELNMNGDYGASYHSGTLAQEPAYNSFFDFLINISNQMLDEHGYDLTNYKTFITEAWVQEFAKDGGGHHTPHLHYNNHVSGFYFLKSSHRTSYPFFVDPRPAKRMTELPLKSNANISPSLGTIKFNVKPGTLIIFPAYLEHGFTVDNGLDPFRFFHFNLQAVQKDIVTFYGK